MELKYSYKCMCGVVISCPTEKQLDKAVERHEKNSKLHKRLWEKWS